MHVTVIKVPAVRPFSLMHISFAIVGIDDGMGAPGKLCRVSTRNLDSSL